MSSSKVQETLIANTRSCQRPSSVGQLLGGYRLPTGCGAQQDRSRLLEERTCREAQARNRPGHVGPHSGSNLQVLRLRRRERRPASNAKDNTASRTQGTTREAAMQEQEQMSSHCRTRETTTKTNTGKQGTKILQRDAPDDCKPCYAHRGNLAQVTPAPQSKSTKGTVKRPLCSHFTRLIPISITHPNSTVRCPHVFMEHSVKMCALTCLKQDFSQTSIQ